jgi:hypothetical protein
VIGQSPLLDEGEALDFAVLLDAALVPSGSPAADGEDADLFADWDHARGHGLGFFRFDPTECATRRVDLRGPTDLDPGPLPMEEAPDDVEALHLRF